MRSRSLTPILAGLLLLTACAPAGTPDDPAAPTDEAPPEEADEAPGPDAADLDGVHLRLLTHDSFDIGEDVLADFEEQTGVTVEVIPIGDAGTTVNQAILTQDSPQGDLLFGVDNTFLSRALDAELFQSYTSPRLDVVPEDLQLDPEHRVTPIDVGDVCLNYDVAWFEDQGLAVPQGLEDLTREEYRGLLAVQNPATSSPGLAFLLATIERFGADGYLDFWEELRANDVVVTDGWSDAYYGEFSAASDGDRPLVVSYASSPPAEVYFADPTPDEAPTGVIDASCFRQIEFVGILATTEHPEAAQAFVDFMLSREFQEDIPLRMFVWPVAEDAELPDVFVEHAQLPASPFEMDPAVIGENREQWIDEWTRTVLR